MAIFRSSSSTLTLTAVLTLLAVATGAMLLAPATAEAEPAHGTHIKYYSNSSKTVQVGYRYYTCEGVLASQWGVTSAYSSSATYGCDIETE